jgi:tetratricopeptide (TPR) repeat protein
LAGDTLDKLAKQAAAKFDAESFPEALTLYKKLLQLRIEALGADHPDVGEAHHLVGETLWALDRYKEAESALSQSLAIMRKHLGPKHKAVGTVLKNIAECRQAWISDREENELSKPKTHKLLLEVLSLVSEAAEIAKAHAVNEKDADYLDTLYSLGEVYIQLDRYAEALPCFEVNLPRFIDSEGARSMDTLLCLRNLASCYRAR